jgi:hypothetical protein
MTKQHWADQVDDMVSRGAVGSDADVRQVVEYLSRNFAKNKPPAGNVEPADAPASSVAAAPSPSTAHAETSEDWHRPKTGVTFDRILNANKEPQNWLTYGGTYQSLHFSPLNQVTPENARNLELKWVFQARWLDPYETTPLVVDGVLYTMQGDDVVALDAASGRLFWIYRYTPVSEARLCCGRISRGLAILGDTLYMAAVDAHLIAIDAKTGHPLWDAMVAQTTSGYTMTVAPLVIKKAQRRGQRIRFRIVVIFPTFNPITVIIFLRRAVGTGEAYDRKPEVQIGNSGLMPRIDRLLLSISSQRTTSVNATPKRRTGRPNSRWKCSRQF